MCSSSSPLLSHFGKGFGKGSGLLCDTTCSLTVTRFATRAPQVRSRTSMPGPQVDAPPAGKARPAARRLVEAWGAAAATTGKEWVPAAALDGDNSGNGAEAAMGGLD